MGFIMETIDSILCLESRIKKAQTNKKIMVSVFFDTEEYTDKL